MNLVSKRVCLAMENFSPEFWSSKIEGYVSAVFEKGKDFENDVGFIDGTLIGISRPDGAAIYHRVISHGQKRQHAIKFQAVTSPSGISTWDV